MTSVDYMHVKAVLTELLELSSDARAQQLERLRVDDRALHDEVASLLEHADEPSDRLDAVPDVRPVLAAAAARSSEISDDDTPRYTLDAPLEPGARVGRFTLGERLGAGGMGVVYAAEQDEPRRAVALKFLADGPSTRELRNRFRREVHVLGRLQHPGIAALYEAGTLQTPVGVRPFFAMQRVGGVSLRAWLDEVRAADEVVELVNQVCDAVAHAHEHGVVHRDLKPSNILVDDGRAVVVDFGIAKAREVQTELASLHTSTGQVLGTLSAMSPEQVAGDVKAIDAHTDVYALGVILFEALTGEPPLELEGLSVPAAALRICETEPRRLRDLRPDLPSELDLILETALAKEPQRRYADAGALGEDLRRFRERRALVAQPLSSAAQLGRLVRRHKAIATGLAIAFVSLVVALIVSIDRQVFAERALDASIVDASRARLVAAASALENGEPMFARDQLDAIVPGQRGWEWRHYDHRLASAFLSLDAVAPASDAAFDSERREVVSLTGGVIERRRTDGSVVSAVTLREGDELGGILSPDGRRAIIVTPEGPDESLIEVWDVTSTSLVGSRRVVSPQSLSFDAAGGAVGWTSSDGVHHWSLDDDVVVSGQFNADRMISGLVVGPRNLFMATGFGRLAGYGIDGTALVSTGIRRVSHQRLGGVAITRDGARVLAATREAALRVIDARTLKTVAELDGHRGWLTAVTSMPDGAHAVSVGADGTLRIWNLDTGALVSTRASGASDVRSLSVSATGRHVLGKASNGKLFLWDVTHPPESAVLRGHDGYVYGVSIVPDGRSVVSGSWDHSLRWWDLATGELTREKRFKGRVIAVRASPTSDRVAAIVGARLEVIDGTEGQVLRRVTAMTRDVFWLDDERLVVGGGGRREAEASEASIVVVDAGTGEVITRVEGDVRVRCVDVHPDGDLVAGGSPRGEVLVASLSGEQPSRVYQLHDDFVTSVRFSPDGRVLLTTSEDGRAFLLDVATGRVLHELRHEQQVWCGAWLPDGSRVVTGCHDGVLRLYDTNDGVFVAALRGHDDYVYALDVARDGSVIVSGSGDRTVRVWRAESAEY